MTKRVLVVDDSPIEQQAMARPLMQSGYSVDIAHNSTEAMTHLDRHDYDLMLLDIIMPDKNGFQFCRQLRKDNRFKETPIIMVTSKDQASDRFWGMKQGATEYITKPFDETELLSTVGRYA